MDFWVFVFWRFGCFSIGMLLHVPNIQKSKNPKIQTSQNPQIQSLVIHSFGFHGGTRAPSQILDFWTFEQAGWLWAHPGLGFRPSPAQLGAGLIFGFFLEQEKWLRTQPGPSPAQPRLSPALGQQPCALRLVAQLSFASGSSAQLRLNLGSVRNSARLS